MITIENIKIHEFVGLDTEIIKSTNQEFVGLSGTIVDETKSMFSINTESGIKHIPKSINGWKFSLSDGDVIVDGSDIAKRSFDRLGARHD